MLSTRTLSLPSTRTPSGRRSNARRLLPSLAHTDLGLRPAAKCLRRELAAALLFLPLLAMSPTGAEAEVECSSANADGSYTVPYDWGLKPSGLTSGANFRLIFVTSTKRDATATDIATYNMFVQTRAKAGHSEITDSCGDNFTVLGSTATVNVRTNTRTRSSDTDASIYWLKGVKVADNYADLYDGSWDSKAATLETGGLFPKGAFWHTSLCIDRQ